MSDSVSSARATASGGVSRPTTSVSPGRVTRPDAASRVSALGQNFNASLAAVEAAQGILSLGSAENVEPIAPIIPFGANPRTPANQDLSEQEPNGRGLLSGSIPVLLAESRAQEIIILANDPGLADISRVTGIYRDTALRISTFREAS